MSHVIIDANNVSNIGFYQAKNVLTLEMKSAIDKLNKENSSEEDIALAKAQYQKNITNNLKSFSVQIFLNMIHRYFKDNKDSTFLFVWDGRNGSAWRKEENSNYKSNRDHSQEVHYNIFIESMKEQKKILENYPVIQFQDIEAEADDLIYNLCEQFENSSVIVISSDSDFIQLPQKFSKTKIWNPRTKKLFQIPKYSYVTYKSIVGDTSDCIGGLYKFGPKKAEKALENNLINLTAEQLEIIENNRRIIDLSLNPFVEKNKQIIKDTLLNSKISLNLENIKKIFFNLKLKSFLLKWDDVIELLERVKKGSKNGEECQST